MNLYNYFTNKEELFGFDKPKKMFLAMTRGVGEPKYDEEDVTKNPNLAYDYAIFMNKPFPEGEDAIAKSAKYSMLYAKHLNVGRWEKGEPAIIKNPHYAVMYTVLVLKRRWEEAEPYIKSNDYEYDRYTAYLSHLGIDI